MTPFHEAQRLQPARFRWLVGFPPALMTGLAIAQYQLGRPLGAHGLTNRELASLAVFLWVVYVWLSRVQLVTDVDAEAISIRMRGLFRHHRISLSSIQSVEVISFEPVRDFGGYGIRSIPNRGRAYVARATRGARCELKGGGFVVIGSSRPDELAAAIQSHAKR